MRKENKREKCKKKNYKKKKKIQQPSNIPVVLESKHNQTAE